VRTKKGVGQQIKGRNHRIINRNKTKKKRNCRKKKDASGRHRLWIANHVGELDHTHYFQRAPHPTPKEKGGTGERVCVAKKLERGKGESGKEGRKREKARKRTKASKAEGGKTLK